MNGEAPLATQDRSYSFDNLNPCEARRAEMSMATNWNHSPGTSLRAALPRSELVLPHRMRSALILVSTSFASIALAGDINGRWITFDQDSGAKRSIVEIKRDNSQFTGRIVELFTIQGEPSDPACDLCSGEQRGKRIRGLKILNLSRTDGEAGYTGRILDPEEGQIYKCIVTLDAMGDRMTIRGYVGIPLFGRNVTWERVK